MLYNTDCIDEDVTHQHVDMRYYATVPSRELDPASGEPTAVAWCWYDRDGLHAADLPEDVVRFGMVAGDAASKAA